MALFESIPSALFSPLASPGAPVYAEVLLQILAETRRHQQPLSRELVVSLVLSALGDGVWIEPYRNDAARMQDYDEVPG